jgi:RNA polymerase sigma-70 factor, ECF subfamily
MTDEREWLAQQFEGHRGHLRGVAYRMLGSRSEADDAVQEAWLRLSRSNVDAVKNLGGWLTTVVARVCLDMLRSRKSRREESLETHGPKLIMSREDERDPEHDVALSESVGLALLVVLETLAPAERVAFVLHDMFDLSRCLRSLTRMSWSEPIVRLSPAGAPTEVRGAPAVGKNALAFSGRARFAQVGLVNGVPGIVVAPRGRLLTVLRFAIRHSRIVEIDVVADPQRLRQLNLGVVN